MWQFISLSWPLSMTNTVIAQSGDTEAQELNHLAEEISWLRCVFDSQCWESCQGWLYLEVPVI